jgi:hypothetical protein
MRWDLIVAFWIGASWGAVLMAWWCSVAVVREMTPEELEPLEPPRELTPEQSAAIVRMRAALPAHVVDRLEDEAQRRLRRAKDLAVITRGRAS